MLPDSYLVELDFFIPLKASFAETKTLHYFAVNYLIVVEEFTIYSRVITNIIVKKTN